MSKVLVTGGAGFIGSNLANKLYNFGKKVYVIDDLSKGRRVFLNKGVDFIEAKIESKKAAGYLRKIKPEFVVHLAAQSSLAQSLKNPQSDLKKNLLPIVPLLDISREIKIKKFVFASSAAVFGETDRLPIDESCRKQPFSTYGLSKLTCEYYLEFTNKHYKLPYITLRFANVYGRNQNSETEGGVVAVFISKILSGKMPVIYGDGNQTRDFVYVEDAVDAVISSIAANVSGDFNVGTAEETTINQLLDIICKASGKKVKPRYETGQEYGVQRNALSYKKIERQLKWKPETELERGIKLTLNFFKGKT